LPEQSIVKPPIDNVAFTVPSPAQTSSVNSNGTGAVTLDNRCPRKTVQLYTEGQGGFPPENSSTKSEWLIDTDVRGTTDLYAGNSLAELRVGIVFTRLTVC
jgi:hypothetical protein